MHFNLWRGGRDQNVSLEVSDNQLAGAFRGSDRQLASNVEDVVGRALLEPLDAPPLSSAIVPGDRITLVTDTGLPQPEAVLTPILNHLLHHGIDAENIRIVGTESDPFWLNRLADNLDDNYDAVELVHHDPSDPNGLAYLASTRDGRRIYLNRHTVEADAFMVVGRTGFDPVVGFQGTASHLFPSLSNDKARFRSRQLAAQVTPRLVELRQRQACDEVAWLAGLFYSLGVALNRDNQIEASWFGHYESVQRAADEHARRQWLIPPPRLKPDLVVASISTNDRRASWEQVACAVELASALVSPEGNIAVVTDLSDPPGPAGRILIDNDNPWNSLAELRESRSGDPLPMTQCARAMSVAKLYLYSNLDAPLLEQMSFIPVASAGELQNLIRRSHRCLVVEDADRFRVDLG